ncbi:hypothetical protein F5B22DRAFT_80436 [Xylaria bambusicola]|uniref:uncharacterized protein n=1 Tax=Xylaria bambusicola TaxID=326684 RepID=UPI0020087C58|nr:uncharacterized protein F5B22DRAFT_80436 [Xylaria bambusicola]KAI0518304.1 hypothetical protein F5B22DRAFT_80436 [Xylaria bambusicola]
MSTPLPPNESRATALEAIIWSEFGVSTVFIFLRLAVRHQKRSLGLDDGLMAGSWLFFLASVIAVQFAAQASGGMSHVAYLMESELSFQIEISYVVLVISIVCTALGKIAIGATILRIVRSASSSERWVVWAVIIVTSVSSILDIFISLFQCGGDPRAIWIFEMQASTTCLDTTSLNRYTTFTAVWQAFADFVFSILPIFIVWRLHMTTKRKVILTVGLGLTLLTGVAAAVKSSFIATQSGGRPNDFTWDLFYVYLLLTTEALLIIMCGSIPTIYPIWFRTSPQPPAGYASHESSYRKYAYRLSRAESARTHRWWQYSRSDADTEIPTDVEIAMLTGTPLQPPPVAAAVSRRSTSGTDDLCYGKIHVVKEVELSCSRSKS